MVASSIPAWSHTFEEIDHETISTVILLPSAESFKVGCCQLQASESMCTKYWLTACSRLPKKKCGLTIAVDNKTNKINEATALTQEWWYFNARV